MKDFRTLGMTLAGLLAGVATALPWPEHRSYGDPADTDYQSRQAGVALPRRREERQHVPAQRPAYSPESAFAFVNRMREAPFEIGQMYRDSEYSFAINQRGEVDDRGLKALDIPVAAKPRLQKIVDAAVGQTSADMLSRVHPNARGSDPERGITVYDIPGDIEAGKAYLGQAERDFATVVTPEQAEHLRRNLESQLAGFGRQGVSITATTDPATKETALRYQTYNPYTGYNGNGLTGQVTQDPMNRSSMDVLAEKVVAGGR